MPARFKGGGGGGGVANVVWGPDFGTEADLVMAGAVAMPTVKLAGGVTAAAAPAMPSLKQVGGVGHAGAPALPTVKQTGGVTAAGDVSLLQYTTSAIVAQKDTWADVVAACPVDVARDGSDLQMENAIPATRKDVLIGWDLSGFPTGATVTSATVTLNLKTAPTTSGSINWGTIATANEGWVESTTRCSTIPATDGVGSSASVAIGTTAGPRDISWGLDPASRTRIADRMGVGYFSLRDTFGVATLTNCVFESADEGGSNNLGPRLTVTFTLPA